MNLFDTATQHATAWVKDMMAELHTEDPHKALHALRASLQALRDRLSVDEAAQLGAQLPLVLRGIFFESWRPSGKPLRIRHKAEFLALVRDKCGPRGDVPADDMIIALFRVLSKHVTSGEMTDVLLSLPSELVEMATGRDGGTHRADAH
jgi:uncharacterized protein (DUF2267 family)